MIHGRVGPRDTAGTTYFGEYGDRNSTYPQEIRGAALLVPVASTFGSWVPHEFPLASS